MNKKSQLPIKWMLGILITLTPVAYWTNQQTQSKDRGISSAASNVSSHKNFFQFLANIIGMGGQNEQMPSKEHVSAFGDVSPSPLRTTVSVGQSDQEDPGDTASNVKASQGTGPVAGQGTNTAQGENDSGNDPGSNSGNNSGENTGASAGQESGNLSGAGSNQEPGNLSGSNAENNPGNNPDMNEGNNPNDNQGANTDQGPGNLSGSNPGSDSGNNPGSNSGNNPGSNSGNNPGSNSGSNSGGNPGNYSPCVVGCYPGCIPGCDPECTPPACSLGINPNNLPTINPVPSDNSVSQNIAQQNQQNDTLAALLLAQKALVAPVEQQAQASKYQTINSQNIPAPSTNQAPADVVAKIKASQAAVSH